MSSEWQPYQLDELCEFINGFAFKSTDYVASSAETVEVFRMGYISRGGGFKEDSTPVFVPRKYGRNLDKYFLKPNDVVIAMTDMKDKVAILGNTAWISHADRFVLNQRVGCIRVKRPDLLNSRFFYFYSNSRPHVTYLRTRANSGVQVNLSTSAIKESMIQIPPLPDQIFIADLLGALDDRITLLRETSTTLEAIAQALFKSWFVDFDPVRAKAEGLEPEGMDAATAALFPDSFEESELGLVPRGWQICSILDIANLLSGGTPKTDHAEYWGGDIPWASAKDVSQAPNSILTGTDRTITALGLQKSATRMIPAFSTVVVARGATTGRMVMFGMTMAMNQTCYALESKAGTPVALYLVLKKEIDALTQKAHGSVFDTITTSTFSVSKTLQIPDALLACFERIAGPLFHRILAGTQQANTLTQLRNTLLPRLISGQLRLAEAEANVENALSEAI